MKKVFLGLLIGACILMVCSCGKENAVKPSSSYAKKVLYVNPDSTGNDSGDQGGPKPPPAG